jgi:hypothetical protein
LGWEIFFAPLTYFQRVLQTAQGPRSLQIRHLFQSSVALTASQMLYLVLAAGFLKSVTGESITSLFAEGLPWFIWALLISIFVSIAWHWANNWRDFPRHQLRHFYIATNRALIRSVMFANSGFFVGVGVATFRSEMTGRLFQPSLLAFLFLGLAVGALMRLTLGIIHFEPLLQVGRQERFYLETWTRRRSFCAAFIAVGLTCLVVTAGALSSGKVHGVEGGPWSPRFGWVVLGYAGIILILGGAITAWGFVFPVSLLVHLWHCWRHRRQRISAAAALSGSPVVYDELFLFPAPGLGTLLRALALENSEQHSIEWMVFVLTQTYKRRTAAKAIANALESRVIRAASLLAHLRGNQAWVDVPALIAQHLQSSPLRTLFEHLTGPLTLEEIQHLRDELKPDAVDEGLAASLIAVLQGVEDLVQAPTMESWPWREGSLFASEDPLHLRLALGELEAAKRMSLQSTVHTPYSELSLALNRALNGLRQVRETLAADPWLGSLCTPALDRWSENLHEQMSRVLSSAELDVYTLPTPLQLDLEQELRLTLTNRGPGRAREISVTLRAEGIPATHDLHPEILAPRRRLEITMLLKPGRLGPLAGEIEITFLDDLGEIRRHLQPLDLLVKGKIEAYRDFPNPFIAGPPLTDGKLFQGRRELLRAFNEPPYAGLLITGPRRIGKTSLLYQLRNIARSHSRPSEILDLQPLAAEEDPQILERRLARALVPIDAPDTLPEALERFLSSGGCPVLLIDESDHLPDIDRALHGKLSAELRGALNRELPFQLVIAVPFGFKPAQNPILEQLLIMLRPVRLALLAPDEIVNLLVEPLAPFIDFLPGAVDRFVQYVGGHPYIAQLLASTVVGKVQERQQNLVDELLMEDAAADVLDDLSAFFRVYQWRDLSPEEQSLLLLLAHRRELTAEVLKNFPSLRDHCLITGSANPTIAMGLYERWLIESFPGSV